MANNVDPDQTAPIVVWVHTFSFYTQLVSYVRQLFAADDFSRRRFQKHFFLGALRVNLSDQRLCYSLTRKYEIHFRHKFQYSSQSV